MRNFTAEARALADQLGAAGLLESAMALRDAIDFASTGTEVLFGLRFHLHRVADTGAPDELKTAAANLAEAIDAALEP